MCAVAQVAGMGVLDDEIDERLSAKIVGKLPSLGLVDPHQGRVDDKAALGAKVQCHLQRLHRVVAAVRVAGEVRLADTRDQVLEASPVGDRRGIGEEEQIAARHEGVGQARLAKSNLSVAGQSRVADRRQGGQGEHMVGAEAIGPLRELGGDCVAKVGADFELDLVALTVVKPDRLDMVVALERPGQTRGRVLTTGEDDEGAAGHQAFGPK